MEFNKDVPQLETDSQNWSAWHESVTTVINKAGLYFYVCRQHSLGAWQTTRSNGKTHFDHRSSRFHFQINALPQDRSQLLQIPDKSIQQIYSTTATRTTTKSRRMLRCRATSGVTLDSGRGKCRLERQGFRGFLKDVFKSKECWGLPQQLLAIIGCLGSSRSKFTRKHTLKSSARTQRDPKTRENQVD